MTIARSTSYAEPSLADDDMAVVVAIARIAYATGVGGSGSTGGAA